ncbi:hypothetical protein [Flammeovirga aprica]|uniref:Lipocalin-like domain-containing protein n=1 Tax=Flammeovirga aprica JL-4 TaxID=694437 RepID=A0A7X9P157_9BACT|nr:hypothetical protein [Flammeovirga aprica]NME67644.1 hypothetical protein [Flammeovirga aprica JL-4]
MNYFLAMNNPRFTHLLLVVIPFFLISCFEQPEEVAPLDLSKNIEGQYIISGFQYEGVNIVDQLEESEIGNSYISVIRENETQVTVRLIFNTDEIQFSWSLSEQNVVALENSEYTYQVQPGITSLNNLHLNITEDGRLQATFSPYLQPNIKAIYASK